MFDIDLSHVPSIPGLPTNANPLVNGISDKSKLIVDRMTSDPGSLFSNPMINSVNLLGDSTSVLEAKVQSIADGSFISDGITAGEAQDFINQNSFEDIRTAMGNFLMHTNRLSGILQSQGINTPGLQQIMTIGKNMQDMATLINSASGCLTALGGATGLFSEGTFGEQTSQIARLLDRIERGLATIDDIANTLAVVANTIRGIIDKDSRFLQQCVNQLQAAAVGLAMEAIDADPCMHFLFEQISNRNPGGIINILSNPIAT